jgi:hypothetical protein
MKVKDCVEQYISSSPTSQNARKSGAHGYLRRTDKGDPIPVDLYMIQNDVLADMEADGPAGQVKRQAVRLSAASEMLWGYMQSGPKEFNASLKSWGWLVNSSIRAMRELVALQKAAGRDGLDLPSAMARVIDDDE